MAGDATAHNAGRCRRLLWSALFFASALWQLNGAFRREWGLTFPGLSPVERFYPDKDPLYLFVTGCLLLLAALRLLPGQRRGAEDGARIFPLRVSIHWLLILRGLGFTLVVVALDRITGGWLSGIISLHSGGGVDLAPMLLLLVAKCLFPGERQIFAANAAAWPGTAGRPVWKRRLCRTGWILSAAGGYLALFPLVMNRGIPALGGPIETDRVYTCSYRYDAGGPEFVWGYTHWFPKSHFLNVVFHPAERLYNCFDGKGGLNERYEEWFREGWRVENQESTKYWGQKLLPDRAGL